MLPPIPLDPFITGPALAAAIKALLSSDAKLHAKLDTLLKRDLRAGEYILSNIDKIPEEQLPERLKVARDALVYAKDQVHGLDKALALAGLAYCEAILGAPKLAKVSLVELLDVPSPFLKKRNKVSRLGKYFPPARPFILFAEDRGWVEDPTGYHDAVTLLTLKQKAHDLLRLKTARPSTVYDGKPR